MYIAKIIIIIIAIIAITLIISVSGVGAVTLVTSKTVEGNFTNFSGPVTIINIETDKIGKLSYVEQYYLMDSSGALKFDRGVKYYDKNIVTGKLTLEILRPNSRYGRPYPAIMEIVTIDGQIVFQEWFKQYKQQMGYQGGQPQESPLIQKSLTQNTTGVEKPQTLPAFGIYAAIFTISTICLSERKKRKKLGK